LELLFHKIIEIKLLKEINSITQKLKKNIQPDIAAYVRLRSPYCNPERGENSAIVTHTDQTLIYQRGMNKELLLDTDGKSYRKVRVEVRCVAENKHEWDTYLKCKNYELDEKNIKE
jgi:hypothetical protein